jgi:group I intron endonuclease
MKSGVYLITIGRFLYYGSSVDIEKRKIMHLSQLQRGIHKNPKLQNAFNKYKEMNHEVVAFCPVGQMMGIEQLMIDGIWGKKYCANLRPVTNSPLGLKQSKDLIERRVAARSGYRHSEKTKMKISESNRKRYTKISRETQLRYMSAEEKIEVKNANRIRLSKLYKGVPRPEEVRRKISMGSIGRIVTNEQKEKIRKALKGFKHSEITRKKMSMARKGVPLSNQNKLSLSASKSKSIVTLIMNNTELQFSSILAASLKIGVNTATLRSWLSGKNPWPNSNSRIQIKGLMGGYLTSKEEVKP